MARKMARGGLVATGGVVGVSEERRRPEMWKEVNRCSTPPSSSCSHRWTRKTMAKPTDTLARQGDGCGHVIYGSESMAALGSGGSGGREGKRASGRVRGKVGRR